MNNYRVQFDRGPFKSGTDFLNPRKLISAKTPEDVPKAFDDLQLAQSSGFWLAGFATYELGYVLCEKLKDLLPPQRAMPLLHFGVFDEPQRQKPMEHTQVATLTVPQRQSDFAQYSKAFKTVHDYISSGDIYQANLTFPMTSCATGSIAALYQHLRERQTVPHGALVDLGGTALLSRSPELFFSLTADGRLTTKPMKGTAPRGKTRLEDDAQRDALQTSEKNRAENLMIVDLLRNDMSRVSEIGTVKVPELFTVESYATLHQMTSRITSKVRAGTAIKELFTALFPCGSITGAPKIRAMQILHALEAGPREAYCGSIGWIAPDGAMEFNVSIRTLMCRADGTVKFNVGGGVVFDSTAIEEYAEAILKSEFAVIE